MSQARFEITKREAYHLEDIMNARVRSDNIRKIKWSFKEESTESDFKWHTFYKPLWLKFLAFIYGSCSLLCYLGIIGSITGIGSNVSVFSLAIHDEKTTPVGIVIFVLLSLGYT